MRQEIKWSMRKKIEWDDRIYTPGDTQTNLALGVTD